MGVQKHSRAPINCRFFLLRLLIVSGLVRYVFFLWSPPPPLSLFPRVRTLSGDRNMFRLRWDRRIVMGVRERSYTINIIINSNYCCTGIDYLIFFTTLAAAGVGACAVQMFRWELYTVGALNCYDWFRIVWWTLTTLAHGPYGNGSVDIGISVAVARGPHGIGSAGIGINSASGLSVALLFQSYI